MRQFPWSPSPGPIIVYLQLFAHPSAERYAKHLHPNPYSFECYSRNNSITSWGATPHDAALRTIHRVLWQFHKPGLGKVPGDTIQFQFRYQAQDYSDQFGPIFIHSELSQILDLMKGTAPQAKLLGIDPKWLYHVGHRQYMHPRANKVQAERNMTTALMELKKGKPEKWNELCRKATTPSRRNAAPI